MPINILAFQFLGNWIIKFLVFYFNSYFFKYITVKLFSNSQPFTLFRRFGNNFLIRASRAKPRCVNYYQSKKFCFIIYVNKLYYCL